MTGVKIQEYLCHNCGAKKPDAYYRACKKCREMWRKAKTPNRTSILAPDVVADLEKVKEALEVSNAFMETLIDTRLLPSMKLHNSFKEQTGNNKKALAIVSGLIGKVQR